jgi:hypothetical protein
MYYIYYARRPLESVSYLYFVCAKKGIRQKALSRSISSAHHYVTLTRYIGLCCEEGEGGRREVIII